MPSQILVAKRHGSGQLPSLTQTHPIKMRTPIFEIYPKPEALASPLPDRKLANTDPSCAALSKAFNQPSLTPPNDLSEGSPIRASCLPRASSLRSLEI